MAGLRDPTLWRGSRWPSGRTCTNAVINIGLVRLSPLRMAQSWPWNSQIAVQKKKKQHDFNSGISHTLFSEQFFEKSVYWKDCHFCRNLSQTVVLMTCSVRKAVVIWNSGWLFNVYVVFFISNAFFQLILSVA